MPWVISIETLNQTICKLTDLGLCKKVGEVSITDHPEVVLEMLRRQGVIVGSDSTGAVQVDWAPSTGMNQQVSTSATLPSSTIDEQTPSTE